jgi:hypothetical protein
MSGEVCDAMQEEDAGQRDRAELNDTQLVCADALVRVLRPSSSGRVEIEFGADLRVTSVWVHTHYRRHREPA